MKTLCLANSAWPTLPMADTGARRGLLGQVVTSEDSILGRPETEAIISEESDSPEFSRMLEDSVFVESDRRTTVHDERTRIAEELHDTLLQTFLGASMQLGVAVDSLPSDAPVKPRLDRILHLLNQGIEEGRNTIQSLRSSDTRPVDLILALSKAQQELSDQPDIGFRVVVVGRERPLRIPVGHEIYRIGKEAVVNAFRHACAKHVEVEVEYADTELCIRVRDNGRGIDPRMLHAGREGHWGLAGMRERATRIGGQLKISSTTTHGTEVKLSVPSGVAFQRSFL